MGRGGNITCRAMPDNLTPLKNAILGTCNGHSRDEALCALALALATIIVTDDAPHLLLDKMVTLMRATVNRKAAPMKHSNMHS